MTLSIWRYAHLALAFVSSLFLLILSITGVILAYDAAQKKFIPYQIDSIEKITLSETLPVLKNQYIEIFEINIDHNDFVLIDAMDEEGNMIKSYIDPRTGELLGKYEPKSQFIQWTTALHRSLFLKETGRVIVGIVSFILMLITITGLVLIIKRQQGLRRFFHSIKKDSIYQYLHVVSGRWMLIPIFIVALTGTIIFMVRLDVMQQETIEIIHENEGFENKEIEIDEIPFFKNTRLIEVKKIEFPFIPDDINEPFIITLNDKVVRVNQVNGLVESSTLLPYTLPLEKWNIDLHTGRTNLVWAIILGLASLNILFFIYSGFVITIQRTRTRIRNKFTPSSAEYILLVGSENGTTLHFAMQIHEQLLRSGESSYLAEINQYTTFPKAKRLIVFTSTYGLGVAPSNAQKIEQLLEKYPQQNTIHYSVVGFGSRAYVDYCAFAKQIDLLLKKQSWAENIVELQTVNDRSTHEFTQWVSKWNDASKNNLSTTPAHYNLKTPQLKRFKVLEKTSVSDDNSTFRVVLKPISKNKFQSGDLIGFYPNNDHQERLYSIGRTKNTLQLMVKLFPGGLGSQYLYDLKVGTEVQGNIRINSHFHFPTDHKKVAMICNGTGIAPFLGMIEENSMQSEITVYAGFRYRNSIVQEYEKITQTAINKNKLKEIHFAFSRELQKQYVMDLIKRDEISFAKLLADGGIIMICGALSMQRDVEQTLNTIVIKYNQQSLSFYKENQQILTDCY